MANKSANNSSLSFKTANNTSLSFKTANDTSLNKSSDKSKSSCCCSDASDPFSKPIGTPMGNISFPPLDKSKLPFGVLMTKLQRKMVRRDAPKGENLEMILRVLNTIEGQDITVQEFMGLIIPYTADFGTVLRAVLNDDTTSFKKMAKKVFETITQDNSDVLLNQQLSIGEYYTEKYRLLQKKMLEAIEEIYDLAPSFDFERYYAEREKYLEELFPLPPAHPDDESEELQMMKRQQAYHHLQWLRTEGERLNAENEAMKDRLNQVKLQAHEDNCKALDLEEVAEIERMNMEQLEADKRAELEELSDALENTIIRKEMRMRKKADESLHDPNLSYTSGSPSSSSPESSPTAINVSRKKLREFREWKESTAKFIDSGTIASHSADTKSRIGFPN